MRNWIVLTSPNQSSVLENSLVRIQAAVLGLSHMYKLIPGDMLDTAVIGWEVSLVPLQEIKNHISPNTIYLLSFILLA